MKDILNKIMNIFKKFLQWLGIKKKEEKKVSSFDGITPMPHLTNESEKIPQINISPIPDLDKDKIDIDKFNEEVKKSENTDEINEKIQKEIPPINITPIPSIPVDKVKVDKPKRKYNRKRKTEE